MAQTRRMGKSEIKEHIDPKRRGFRPTFNSGSYIEGESNERRFPGDENVTSSSLRSGRGRVKQEVLDELDRSKARCFLDFDAVAAFRLSARSPSGRGVGCRSAPATTPSEIQVKYMR
jgi:hypothetical protein